MERHMLESSTNPSPVCNHGQLLENSLALKSGMGAVAWAVLEMFRRGGMDADKVNALHADMNKFFTIPSNDECNSILKVVEERLRTDKATTDSWY
jgi:hypothetical protein